MTPAPLAPVSLRLGLTRRRVKRRSRLEAGDGLLLDTLVDQALDRGQQRPVFAAQEQKINEQNKGALILLDPSSASRAVYERKPQITQRRRLEVTTLLDT
ncbi:MAG: hypothetical protein ACREVH_04015 [Gammaproteobacteria bacterium]